MTRRARAALTSLVLAALLVTAGCGDDGDDDGGDGGGAEGGTDPAESVSVDAAPTPTPSEPTSTGPAPATGPRLTFEVGAMNAPAGFVAAESMTPFEVSADADVEDGSSVYTFVFPDSDGPGSTLAEAEAFLRKDDRGKKVTMLEPVEVDGVTMAHARVVGGYRPQDKFYAEVGSSDVTLAFRLGDGVSKAVHEQRIAEVLASVDWQP